MQGAGRGWERDRRAEGRQDNTSGRQRLRRANWGLARVGAQECASLRGGREGGRGLTRRRRAGEVWLRPARAAPIHEPGLTRGAASLRRACALECCSGGHASASPSKDDALTHRPSAPPRSRNAAQGFGRRLRALRRPQARSAAGPCANLGLSPSAPSVRSRRLGPRATCHHRCPLELSDRPSSLRAPFNPQHHHRAASSSHRRRIPPPSPPPGLQPPATRCSPPASLALALVASPPPSSRAPAPRRSTHACPGIVGSFRTRPRRRSAIRPHHPPLPAFVRTTTSSCLHWRVRSLACLTPAGPSLPSSDQHHSRGCDGH